MDMLVWLLLVIWMLLGVLATNFMWVVKDLKSRVIEDHRNNDLKTYEYYANIYTRGMMFGLLLGPFCWIWSFIKLKEVTKELDQLEDK